MQPGLFRRIWNKEINSTQAMSKPWLWVLFVLAIVFYPIGELLLFPPASDFITPAEYGAATASATVSWGFIRLHFYEIWLGLLITVILFRIFIQIRGFQKGFQSSDRGIMMRNFAVYFPSVSIGIAIKILLTLLVALVWFASGHSFSEGMLAIENAGLSLGTWIQNHIPTLVNVNSKILALAIALTLFGLTNYFIHWLTHTSRLLWHVVHAPHHMPDYLNPVASPVANFLDILILVPGVILQSILAKLFYAEPLILEIGLITLFAYAFEIFNHTTVFYRLCAQNPILKFITNFLGGHGAYHYVHHSSAKEHQKANLGGGLFLMWDRVFGTFADPPKELPAIGLTGNPEIRMNPLRIMFGGIARIIFELKMNRGLRERVLILFGGIHYMPPVTREFVKKNS